MNWKAYSFGAFAVVAAILTNRGTAIASCVDRQSCYCSLDRAEFIAEGTATGVGVYRIEKILRAKPESTPKVGDEVTLVPHSTPSFSTGRWFIAKILDADYPAIAYEIDAEGKVSCPWTPTRLSPTEILELSADSSQCVTRSSEILESFSCDDTSSSVACNFEPRPENRGLPTWPLLVVALAFFMKRRAR